MHMPLFGLLVEAITSNTLLIISLGSPINTKIEHYDNNNNVHFCDKIL
jgi:hypothetical protein